jgi:hypothetical protein
VLDEVTRSADGSLYSFVLRFEQFCPNSLDPLRGFVRYVKDDPTRPPPAKDPSTYPWQPPAGALPATGNWLYIQSTPGEWVGQGQTMLLSVDTATSVSWEPGGVQLTFSVSQTPWWFKAAVPEWVPLWQTGWYPAADGAAANPVKAPLNFSGNGRGCNAVTGDLVVDTASYDTNGALSALNLRFTQVCDGDTIHPLHGVLRWTR